ncbi:MAG: 6-hydroxycyclohex-1-ene-1-carbonyl-CoA dehydrogenase [Myxococcota bacterium]
MESVQIHSFQLESGSHTLVERSRSFETKALGPEEVLIAVAGCGVCHTDVGFAFDGVAPKHALPLTLGHEIAGTVVATGPRATQWMNAAVVVPAVVPCGSCALCTSGRATICRSQIFYGSDCDGGFASHVVATSRGLCPVDRGRLAAIGLELGDLGVVADAVTTPFQAIERAGLAAGELAIFVGAGGVGSFGVQIARARGARTVAIDVDPERLARAKTYGAELVLNSKEVDARGLRSAINDFCSKSGASPYSWKIFETSGNAKGQELAYALLGFGATLSVVGFTLDKIPLRLSNLMAFDATAQGNWGCLPERYPAALELVLSGTVAVKPFIERRPMHQINQTFTELHEGKLRVRPVLIPDWA